MFVFHASPPPQVPAVNEESQIDSGSYVFRDEAILGTRMQINLVARNYSDAQAAALGARAEIDRLNMILNSRSSKSELYLLNRSRTHRASPELFAVVEAAERWRVESGGAFSGRLGLLIDRWRNARERIPPRDELARMALAANQAQVVLNTSTRTITRPDAVTFALDALAKGWIVDRAYEVARSSPGVSGALIDIGGDIRSGGRAPDSRGWCVGIPDATHAIDNAPLMTTTYLRDDAIATSGRGPRDRIIDGVRFSPTLSPRDGWPIEGVMSVSAVAPSAAEADALATTLMAMPAKEGREWADRKNAIARIQSDREVQVTSAAEAKTSKVRLVAVNAKKTKAAPEADHSWPKGWAALITFTAPPRQLKRDEHFRSPYMAMWITDTDNKPIRTLLLVGTRNDWQQDNFIWWALNSDNNQKLVGTRSMSTMGSGVYKVLWDGFDDQGKNVPGGTYVLHIETSREHGRHTHRSLTIDFSEGKAFTDELASTEEAGGVNVRFYRL